MKYIISGLAPGTGGVPKLLEYFKDNSSKNFKLITPPQVKVHNKYLNYLLQILILKVFRYRLFFIRNKTLVLIHFQSIGLKESKYLIRKNRVYLYLIDNTFFCLKSYNNRKGRECLDCLEESFSSVVNQCNSFHFKHSRKAYISFYKFLSDYSERIFFLTLSDTQAELLRRNFSVNISVQSLYFLTDDLDLKNFSVETDEENSFDIVFHGSSHPSKGSEYLLELSRILPEFKFLFPFDAHEICTQRSKPENAIFNLMSWETGLKESVANAKLVVTPSNWSNTPEASTLKSLLVNGKVAMLDTKFGYVNELRDSVLCLTGKIEEDKNLVRSYLKNQKTLFGRKTAERFSEDYMEKAKLFKEFFEIQKND